MGTSISSNSRIMKNTAMLYIRMFISMAISLYTSRVILEVLGISDYGIYNVVGGIVVLFSFLQNALSTATQRFLNFEMGKQDGSDVRKVFRVSVTAHIVLALLVLVLSEIVGIWFLENKINVPADRMDAARVVFQFSVISCCINIIRSPLSSLVIAYEEMSFFAYLGIGESVLRLLIVFLLLIIPFDSLIAFAALTFLVFVLLFIINYFYCKKRHNDVLDFKPLWDNMLSRDMLGFSGWSMLLGVANVGCDQGVNMVLNVFRGVIVNAAMGVANQVSNAVYGFVSNFQLAYAPQIVKLYAAGEYQALGQLVRRTSKFSYFMMLVISLPLIFCCEDVLNLWLKEVPQYAVSITQIIICIHLIDSLSAPLWLSIQATGKIKYYQIICSAFLLTNIPAAIVILKLGYSPIIVILFKLFIALCVFLFRVPYVCGKIELKLSQFINDVILRCTIVTLISVTIVWLVYSSFNGLTCLLLSIVSSVFSVCLSAYFLGINKDERNYLVTLIKKRFNINEKD